MEGVAHGIELNPSFSFSQQGDQVVQQTEHVQQQSQSVQQGLDAQAKLSQIDVQQLRAQIQQQFQEQFEAQVQQLQAEIDKNNEARVFNSIIRHGESPLAPLLKSNGEAIPGFPQNLAVLTAYHIDKVTALLNKCGLDDTGTPLENWLRFRRYIGVCVHLGYNPYAEYPDSE